MATDGAENNRNMTEHSVNEMIQESKLLESYYNDIVSKESMLHRLLEESHNSFEAIKNLSIDSDTLSLVPLGIGVYVESSINPINKVLVNVGGGVVIEKKKDDAVNFIEQRIKEFETAAKQLSSQKQQISYRMMDIQNTVNSYVGQMQEQTHNRNHSGHSSPHSH
jgi:prefoldin alpha subunit